MDTSKPRELYEEYNLFSHFTDEETEVCRGLSSWFKIRQAGCGVGIPSWACENLSSNSESSSQTVQLSELCDQQNLGALSTLLPQESQLKLCGVVTLIEI